MGKKIKVLVAAGLGLATVLAMGQTSINRSRGFSTLVQTGVYTVATLPTCNAATKAARAYATDANTTHTLGIGATVAAGGANNVPVVCDGTNWKIG